MKYELIEHESTGKFDATLEMRANYEFIPYPTTEGRYRPLASRTWEVYNENSQLLFTVMLKEQTRYRDNYEILQTDLYIKLPASLDESVQEYQKSQLCNFSQKLNKVYCINNYISCHKPGYYEAFICLSQSNRQSVVRLYEYLQSNDYFQLPSALVEEIDDLAYKKHLTKDELAIYY